MTDGSHITVQDTRAPLGQFRVVCWRVREGRAYESFVDGDFIDRKAAKDRARGLAIPDLLWVAVYDSSGRVRHNCIFTNKANLARPIAVTKLAGFTDPAERTKRGTYRRR